MAESVVFIIHFTIKNGRDSDIREHYQNSIQATLNAKPGSSVTLEVTNFPPDSTTVITINGYT